MASRIASLLAKCISPHQHGFIKGRSIFDNVYSFLVGNDFAQATRQKCVLLQLDMDKAYDRVH